MTVRLDPTTGTHTNSDGTPAYTCALCGNGYATAATRDNTEAHHCEGMSRDLSTYTEARGILAEGYTSDDINAVIEGLATVTLMCVWDYKDDYGFGGDSHIIGRAINPDGTHATTWHPLSAEFFTYLNDLDGNHPGTLDTLDTFLSAEPYEITDPLNLPVREGVNLARTRA